MRILKRGQRIRALAPLIGLTLAVLVGSISQPLANDVGGGAMHALAMHGAPKYLLGFSHVDYVNPAAPKGGMLRLARLGSFDNLNPFIVKGTSPPGRHYVFESLLKRSSDEPFTLYGLIAETVEVAPTRSWIRFHLSPEARFHDGTPITTDDVAFSYRTLRTAGRPNHRLYYKQVDRIEIRSPRRITFYFRPDADREMALIIGLLPILSKNYYQGVAFNKMTLVPPLGSGPYRVDHIEAGQSIIYRRVADYWARELPINRGRYNFDVIRYDFYRDANARFEAFKAGEFDFHHETSPSRWANGYGFPAAKNSLVVKESVDHGRPAGMHGIVFNTRRNIFAQRRVRLALAHVFDFEWLNKNLFHGTFARTASFFANSELAAAGYPGEEELALLERFRRQVPDQVFGEVYQPPVTDGSGSIRANLKRAISLLEQAGWTLNEGHMERQIDGRRLSFELLLAHPSNERIAFAFAQNLKRVGVALKVRTVDWAQYQGRSQAFDFDAVIKTWHQSLSPGNEQRYYWGTEAAGITGSGNLAGIHDPVVDELTNAVASAVNRMQLIAGARALDRVLRWGHYVVPLFHAKHDRIAYWDKFGRPAITPAGGFVIDTWWDKSSRQ